MCSAFVSVHGLKNEFIFMCSALVSAHGLKHVMCSAHHGFSLIDRGGFKS